MIVLDKYFDRLTILYNPVSEKASVGESLVIFDPTLPDRPNGAVAQVIEERPYLPMAMRDSLLIESLTPDIGAKTEQPAELGAAKSDLRNQKTLIAKVRLSASVDFQNGKVESFGPWNGWSPTPSCAVVKIPDPEILKYLDLKGTSNNVATLGKTTGSAPFDLNLFYLHGVSTLVGGRGTGKSHLAKKLALGLIDAKRRAVVFDINDEWGSMRLNTDGSESKYANKITRANPGENLSFDLKYLGRIVFASVLRMMNVEESSATMQTIMNKWKELERDDKLTLENLKTALEDPKVNEKVRDALVMRLNQLEGSGIVVAGEKGTSIQELLEKIEGGGLLVVNLKDKTKLIQYVIVQLFISKLAGILSDPTVEPMVFIVEEAQTYMSNFEIEEVVARLRHLGLHQIYITNSAQSLTPFLMSHISNWFVFNLVNEQDIMYLQKSLPLDLESATVLVKSLAPRNALVLINENYNGVTKNYPLIVKVDPIPYQTAGATRELFPAP